jgi:hypothetical protein
MNKLNNGALSCVEEIGDKIEGERGLKEGVFYDSHALCSTDLVRYLTCIPGVERSVLRTNDSRPITKIIP